jgi:hypothetical protein
MGWPEAPKFGRVNYCGLIDSHLFLNLNQKKKKLHWFKVSQSKILKNRGCPPFEMKRCIRRPFSWHDKVTWAV